LLATCGSPDSAADKAKIAELQAENDKLKAQLAALQSNGAAAATNTASNSAAGTPAPSPAFSDISGIEGETHLKDLATLGVLDGTFSDKFDPRTPIKRADYVRWLVKTSAVYFPGDNKNRIRFAQEGDTPTFVDVPATDANFKYIQGMANAGYVVGVDKTHFAPAQPLTREQMIGIKAQVDEGSSISKYNGDIKGFLDYSDKYQINDAYADAVHEDNTARTTHNISRVWGNIKTFNPQKSVTRAEAAITLAELYDTKAADVVNKPKSQAR